MEADASRVNARKRDAMTNEPDWKAIAAAMSKAIRLNREIRRNQTIDGRGKIRISPEYFEAVYAMDAAEAAFSRAVEDI